jgi:hypothetical protein
VKEEVEAFAKSILDGKADSRASPREASIDLEIIESILVSGQQNGTPQSLTVKQR